MSTHETLLVSTPPLPGKRHGRVRPLCTCGWEGAHCDSRADAELAAQAHTAPSDDEVMDILSSLLGA